MGEGEERGGGEGGEETFYNLRHFTGKYNCRFTCGSASFSSSSSSSSCFVVGLGAKWFQNT